VTCVVGNTLRADQKGLISPPFLSSRVRVRRASHAASSVEPFSPVQARREKRNRHGFSLLSIVLGRTVDREGSAKRRASGLPKSHATGRRGRKRNRRPHPLLLYKAQALRGLGFLDGALEVLSEAVKRKKDRSDELLKALRYERALVYEGLRQDRKARAEWEKLYAEDPDYEDVAARLERTC